MPDCSCPTESDPHATGDSGHVVRNCQRDRCVMDGPAPVYTIEHNGVTETFDNEADYDARLEEIEWPPEKVESRIYPGVMVDCDSVMGILESMKVLADKIGELK